jgi:hypothetical protein
MRQPFSNCLKSDSETRFLAKNLVSESTAKAALQLLSTTQ